MSIILNILRRLPNFKGKFTLAEKLAKPILNRKESVSFYGKKNVYYSIPNTIETVGKDLIINGIYESKTISLIQKLLRNEGIFFDVGANIGSITLPVAKLSNAKVHAFEPSRLSFQYLEKNVSDNNLKNVTLNNVAVHSIDGKEFTFYEAEEKYGNSSLTSIYHKQTEYKVNSISLDAYCKRNRITKIDVLKVDVQGYELDVLQGAENLIKNKSINYIIFEMEAWAETLAGHEAGASQNFLLKQGYTLYDMEGKKRKDVLWEKSAMFLASREKL